MPRNDSEFPGVFKKLRSKSGKSKYKLAQDSGLNQAYISRLETGERQKPSRDAVLKLAVALVTGCEEITIHDVQELLIAADHAPLRNRGEPLPDL